MLTCWDAVNLPNNHAMFDFIRVQNRTYDNVGRAGTIYFKAGRLRYFLYHCPLVVDVEKECWYTVQLIERIQKRVKLT